MYVGIEDFITNSSCQLHGLFRSGDGGAHWTQLDLPMTTENGTRFGINPGGQGSIHFSILADPANVNLVYVGGDRQPARNEAGGPGPFFPNSLGALNYSGRLFRIDASKAPGSQFAHLTNSNTKGPAGGGTAHNSSPHADSRAMTFDANGNILEVDDGGIFRRTRPRNNTGDWFSVNSSLQVTEFHDIAYDGNSRIVIGGTQDTGTPQQQTRGGTSWNEVAQGDGGDVEARLSATAGISLRYSSFDNLGGFRKETYNASNVLQGSVFPALTVISGSPIQPQFYTPIKANAVDPNRLIIGAGNSVYESLNQGGSVREVGAGIVANDAIERKALVYGGRSAGVNDPNVIYAGAGDRVFVRTAAAPASFKNLTTYLGRGSGREVNGIAVDPNNYKTVYVVDTSHVYRSINTGTSWTDITGNLRGSLDSIEFLSRGGISGIVVGTHNQVFLSRTTAPGTWNQLGTGLPNARVERLNFDPAANLLVAGTLGRGAWSILNPLGP